MTDEQLVQRFLEGEGSTEPAFEAALRALLAHPEPDTGAPLRPLLAQAVSGVANGFSRRQVLARIAKFRAVDTDRGEPEIAAACVVAPALRQSQVDTSEELQTLQQGAVQGRFDGGRTGGWRIHLPAADAGEWECLLFVPPRFPHRELVLRPEVDRWTLTGLDDLRKRLDTNSAIVLCYIFSLFRATAPQFPPGRVVSIEVNLTEVARLCGLPYRNGKESTESRRVVWEALLYAAAARITGRRKTGRDRDQKAWVQQLTVPFLTIGARLSAPHPEDATLFAHADPPLKVRLHCEPELLAYISGALASYIPGGELLALLPAHQTSSALARSYALHSLTRWRVYRERGLNRMPEISMQELLREVPPAGETAFILQHLASGGTRNSGRLLLHHSKALRDLVQIGLIEPHADASEAALKARLKVLGGTLPDALWSRPMPLLLPSERLQTELQRIQNGKKRESQS